jgi:hypothetical protein
LNVPVVSTDDKKAAESSNRSYLDIFTEENCHYVPGEMVTVADFFERFHDWLPVEERHNWTKHKIGKELPKPYIKGRNPGTSQFNYGNMSWSPQSGPVRPKLVLTRNETLRPFEG